MTTPTPTTVQVKIQLRRDTAAAWASVNPVLLAGEAGLETDTNKIKIGNGSTAWNSLGYFPFVVNGGTVTGNLEIGTTGTLTFEGSSADNFETTLGVINPTADRTINLPNVSGTIITTGDTGTVTSTMIADGTIVDADVSASAEIAVSKLADGAARQLLQTDAAGTGVEWTSNVDIPGTLDVTGTATFDGAVTVAGDLTVNGTTTTISTQNLLVEDKNIILGDVATPSDTTADGGGITLKGATDKTINWVDSTDAWTSSERFSVPLGSAASPSLTFTGDENSGVYSPGADQVAISTGGSGRLFIDASGNVGVGVSPSAIFEAAGSEPVFGLNHHVTQYLTSTKAYNATPGGGIALRYKYNSANDYTYGAGISFEKDNTVDGDFGSHITIQTRPNAGSATERLRITSAGLVGVGTSSPSSIASGYGVIHIAGTNGGGINFGPTTGAVGYAAGSASGVEIGTIGTTSFSIFTNNQTRATVTSAGLVGIGTSSVSANLHIKESAANTYGIIRVEGTGRGGEINFYNGATAQGAIWGNSSTLNFGTGSSLTQAMIIDSSQRVGIGTTTVNTTLEVLNSSTPIIRVGDGTRHVQLWGGSSTQNQAVGTATSAAFNININSSPVATFDTSGRLLVGTSSSITNALEGGVQIVGTAADAYLTLTRFGGANTSAPAGIILGRSRSGTKGTNTAVSDGDFLGVVEFTGADGGSSYRSAAQIGAYVDGVVSGGGAADMPGRLVFSTTADGASSPTERMKITQSGEIYVYCGSGSWNFIANNASTAGTASALYSGRYSVTDNTGTTGTQSYVVWTNGNVQNTNNSYTAISDIKLKENVVDANSQWADIKSLQVRNYNLKEGQTHRQIGLIAQEVEPISPGLVYESPDRDAEGNDLGTVTKSVNYSVLYMKAVKALQEAMERIETLEAKVAALESA